ncbi:MAG: ZIP family metal transporter [Thermoplasmataceae archaeon]
MSFFITVLLSAIMGFSIFLTFPIIMAKRISEKKIRILSSISVGILLFLIADIFTDASSIMYNGTYYGYGSNPFFDAIFLVSLISGFFIIYFAEGIRKNQTSPYRLALFIAIGIGFQNLTEGMVFGADNFSIGLVGVTLVILVGFILQNVTEGFPIVSPFLGQNEKSRKTILVLLFIGGFPTILGGGVGYFYSSNTFNLIFDGLAIGAMFYVVIPILKHLLKEQDASTTRLIYSGAFAGFVLGFLVNLI